MKTDVWKSYKRRKSNLSIFHSVPWIIRFKNSFSPQKGTGIIASKSKQKTVTMENFRKIFYQIIFINFMLISWWLKKFQKNGRDKRGTEIGERDLLLVNEWAESLDFQITLTLFLVYYYLKYPEHIHKRSTFVTHDIGIV